MTTFSEMVDVTLAELNSYSKNQESITVLLSGIDADDLEFVVDDVNAISKGTIEINDELVYVKSISKTYATATIMPGGRGWRNSSAASHAQYAIVRNNPMFPRVQIKRSINEIITALDIPVLNWYEFTYDGHTTTYPLPVGTEEVTGVTWERPDGTDGWDYIKYYDVDNNYRTTDAPTVVRKAIVLREAPMPGATVRVQYTSDPVALADGDNFSDCGLPATCEDVVRLGAMWKMLSMVEAGRLATTSATDEAVSNRVGAGQSTNIARYIYQMYQIRLAEERSRQEKNFQQIVNYTR